VGLYVKYPLFLSVFNELEFSLEISKSTQMPKFTKIRAMGAELFHADGRTDRKTDRLFEADSGFSHFRISYGTCNVLTHF